MKIETYAIEFSGLDAEPQYAAATTKGRPLWAVARGSGSDAARRVISRLEDLDLSGNAISDQSIEAVFGRFHAELEPARIAVSVAGAFSDEKNFTLFNIGNARVLLFSEGYVVQHTDDHSGAYRAFAAEAGNSTTVIDAAYDRLRDQFPNNRPELWKALGFGSDARPQFYPPIPIRKNCSLLICTDTFWRYLSVIEMELDYRKAAGPAEWLNIMARRVLMKAGQELDNENFAAVAVMVEE